MKLMFEGQAYQITMEEQMDALRELAGSKLDEAMARGMAMIEEDRKWFNEAVPKGTARKERRAAARAAKEKHGLVPSSEPTGKKEPHAQFAPQYGVTGHKLAAETPPRVSYGRHRPHGVPPEQHFDPSYKRDPLRSAHWRATRPAPPPPMRPVHLSATPGAPGHMATHPHEIAHMAREKAMHHRGEAMKWLAKAHHLGGVARKAKNIFGPTHPTTKAAERAHSGAQSMVKSHFKAHRELMQQHHGLSSGESGEKAVAAHHGRTTHGPDVEAEKKAIMAVPHHERTPADKTRLKQLRHATMPAWAKVARGAEHVPSWHKYPNQHPAHHGRTAGGSKAVDRAAQLLHHIDTHAEPDYD